MSKTLYKRRGGGQLGNLLPAFVISFRGATWPFCRLIMTDTDVTFSFLSKSINLSYKDIERITITRTGYVQFIAKQPSLSFAFTGFGIRQITDILQRKEVPLDPVEEAKVNTAAMIVTLQAAFVGIVLIAIVVSVVR
jgi:hypothetical protein